MASHDAAPHPPPIDDPRAIRRGLAAIAVAATLWGLLGPVARVALEAGVAPLEVAFWRAAIGAALFGAQAAVRRPPPIAARDRGLVLALGLAGVAVFYAAYLQAVRAGGAALAAVLLYTAPVWVALGSGLWLRERVSARGALGLALTVGGVALVSLGGAASRVTPAAVGWGVLAGLTYALYYLLGRPLFRRYPAEQVLALALAVGAVGLAPFVAVTRKPPVAWLAIAGVAVVPTWLAYHAYAAGLRRIDATRASTVATLEPIVATAVAYAAWGERLAPLAWLGAVAVLAGVLVGVGAHRGAPAGEGARA